MLRVAPRTVLLSGRAPPWVLRANGTPARLDIDFVGNRAFNGIVSPISSLLTCTRSSSGDYYTKADGTLTTFAANTLRYGDNGLLVEEARTNLFLQSQTFNNASWEKPGGSPIATDSTAAPDGTTTADTFTAAGNDQCLLQVVTGAISTTYTASMFFKIKTAGVKYARIYIGGGGVGGTDGGAIWDLDAGTLVSLPGADVSSTSITALANGWYRCSVTFTTSGADNTFEPLFNFSDNADGDPNTGNDGYFWGAQLEVGSFATSYIPTTTTSATRAADVITDASNFSTWYNQTAGSFYCQFDETSVFQDIFGVDNTTFNEAIGAYGNYAMWVRDGGVTQVSTVGSGPNVNPMKVAIAYAADDFAGSVAGGAAMTDASGTLPTPTRLTLGKIGNGVASANNRKLIKRIAYFNSRLSNAALVALST
jgi:hypothetical protein